VQKTHHSGFAWLIAHNTNALWEGVGLAPGQAEDMHSGHPKAFRMLAALIFLSHYIQSYGPANFTATMIKCFCDNNDGVVTTTKEMQGSTTVHPNDATNNDWDVYLAIIKVIAHCAPLTLQFSHVMGHQPGHQSELTPLHHGAIECGMWQKG